MVDIRNDSGLTTEDALALLADATEIKYGNITMRIETHLVDAARAYVANLKVDDRTATMESVDCSLRRDSKRIASGRFTKIIADRFSADLCLWYALKETIS